MKKTLIILSMGALLAACNKKAEKNTDTTQDTVATDTTTAAEKSPGGSTQFDINSVPVSNAEVGDFPFQFSQRTGIPKQTDTKKL